MSFPSFSARKFHRSKKIVLYLYVILFNINYIQTERGGQISEFNDIIYLPKISGTTDDDSFRRFCKLKATQENRVSFDDK